ncbi:MAG: hypothetical protein L3K26_20400, partial [Candidatus Hydrogenedentes bacterium]|nr:hypothetical protein [Candidatus Hydrogenedentota bacterium]
LGLEGTQAKAWAIVGCGTIMLAYTLLGGLWAVMITDFIQFIVMAVAVLVMAPLATTKAGGVMQVLNNLPEGFSNITNGAYTWPWLLSFSVILALTYATKWPYVQRYYAARSDKDARRVGYTVAVLTLFGPPLLFWPAMAATQFLPDVADPNDIYPMICRLLLPVGLMGVVVAAMFSATMSMLSSDYNALASVITNDIIKRYFAPQASERTLLRIARVSTLVVGALAMALAIKLVYTENLADLVKIMARLFSVLLPPVALPMAAGLLSRRASGRGAIAGFALGAASGIGAYALSFNADLAYLGTVPYLTWISLLPTAFGLVAGSKLWPDTPAKQEIVNTFLDGLGDDAPSEKSAPDMRDGFYAMQIIGITCALLGTLLVAAVLLTANIAEGGLSIGVGLVLGAGGGAAAWIARRRLLRADIP